MKPCLSSPGLRAAASVLTLLTCAQAQAQPVTPSHPAVEPIAVKTLPNLSNEEIETRVRTLIASLADLSNYVTGVQSNGALKVRSFSSTSACSKPPKITDPGKPVSQAQLESAARVLMAVNAATQSGKPLKIVPVTWSCNFHPHGATP